MARELPIPLNQATHDANDHRIAGVLGLGKVVKTYLLKVTGNPTSSAVIPADASIPQITEGVEWAQLVVTAQNAANWLQIRYNGEIASDTPAALPVIALFWDAVANALQVSTSSGPIEPESTFAFEAWHQPGDIASHTYRIRVGPHIGATIKASAGSAGLVALWAGATYHTFTITEYAPN